MLTHMPGLPRPIENAPWSDQVPFGRQAPVVSPASFQVVWRSWAPVFQRLEMPVLNHQGVTMLLQEQPDLGGDGGVLQQQRVIDYAIQIEELHEFQRAPHLLPSAAQSRAVQPVHPRTLQARNAHADAGAFERSDLEEAPDPSSLAPT